MHQKDDSPKFYTASTVRELDRIAIEEHHIPGYTLMQKAGQSAFNVLLKQWPQTETVMTFCGTGNNGGDGFIIAGLAKKSGLNSIVYLHGNPDALKGDALKAYQYASESGLTIRSSEHIPHSLQTENSTIVVDALLGTGLKGHVREDFAAIIEMINSSGLPVLAVDIPSGLCSDSGQVLGTAIKADATVTFIGRKIGQVIGKGPEYCGELYFNDLDVPAEIFARVSSIQPST